MKTAIALLVMLSSAYADVPYNALVDQQGLVIFASRAALPPATGTLVTTTALFSDGQIFARFTDEYGRSLFRIDRGAIVEQQPTLSRHTDTRRRAVRVMLFRLDALTEQMLALERWQADHVDVMDRSGELSSVSTQIDSLIAKVKEAIGP